jgi:hypothetical protein
MMKFLSQAIKLIFITSLISSCAAIPAKKIKLDNYPKIEDASGLSLARESEKFEPDYRGLDFAPRIIEVMDQELRKNKSVPKNQKPISTNCSVKISAMHYAPLPRTCIANYFLAGLTLFTIPYYCQHIFEAKATLISYPKDSEITGNIVPSISSAKIGDLFLDENNRPAKLLKTYDLKDKVHEVWSLIWTLTWFFVDTKRYSSATSPEGAAYQTEETISEALVRSILNDANKFEECRVR